MPRLIVIGAGPAGMMAAGQAAELGAEVILLEKTKSPGRKLRLTGAGRCNLTNSLELTDFLSHVHGNGRFLRQALSRFFSTDLISFMEEIGVPTVAEPTGHIYPASGRAVDVVNGLRNWLHNNSVDIRTDCPVAELVVESQRITGVKTRSQTIQTDSVIIASGGESYPETGCTGDGYRLAEAVGHNIVPVRPSLIPLEIPGDIPARLQGLSLSATGVTFLANDKRFATTQGEVLFTHFGVSGPAVLRLSRQVVDALRSKQTITMSLDLLPDLNQTKLNALLLDAIKAHGKRMMQNLLSQWLPARLAPMVLESSDIKPDTPANQVGSAQRKQLLKSLKDFRLNITGHRPMAEAIVTAGGVDTGQVDPRTMASQLVKNLYFAGEVLDVDGDSGGFNLQIAFSTGWLAGRSAAQDKSP